MGAVRPSASQVDQAVADTGPVLHLHEVSALYLLACFGKIHLVPIVVEELGKYISPEFSNTHPDWVCCPAVSESAATQMAIWVATGSLHAGEAQALAYAWDTGIHFFLTDDTAARLKAESLGIIARGSLGVILYSAALGVLEREEAERRLSALATSSTLWLSPVVRSRAEITLAEIFADQDIA